MPLILGVQEGHVPRSCAGIVIGFYTSISDEALDKHTHFKTTQERYTTKKIAKYPNPKPFTWGCVEYSVRPHTYAAIIRTRNWTDRHKAVQTRALVYPPSVSFYSNPADLADWVEVTST